MELHDDLRLARRIILGIEEFTLLKDFEWSSNDKAWVLKCRLKCNYTATEFVPKETDWYLIVEDEYPYGNIKLYPCNQKGISTTFQHQNYNEVIKDKDWLSGDICVATAYRSFSRKVLDEEPFEANSRLKWHIERAVDWLSAAANNDLVRDGEPFELPPFPKKLKVKTIAFNESEESFKIWETAQANVGLAKIMNISGGNYWFVQEYQISSKPFTKCEWGSFLNNCNGKEVTATWIKLPAIPIDEPWRLPRLWSELQAITLQYGVDVKKIIANFFNKGSAIKPECLLVGFPIPEVIGGEEKAIHWFALAMPSLPNGKAKADGFRPGSEGKHFSNIVFSGDNEINWLRTENWNKKEITSRGTLASPFQVNIAIVGVGALGSTFSEMLVRLGVEKLTVIDNDLVQIGNFSRHTLTMPALLKPKAQAVAERLNSIFPFADIKGLQEPIQNFKPEFFKDYEMIFDLTGSDEVLAHLSNVWPNNKTFVSLSTGFFAKRLFCFLHKNCANIEESFRSKISPWLIKEREENTGIKMPREGLGCWHPIHPTRLDDIYLLLGAAIKLIERRIGEDSCSELIVIEKKINDRGDFMGIEIIEN